MAVHTILILIIVFFQLIVFFSICTKIITAIIDFNGYMLFREHDNSIWLPTAPSKKMRTFTLWKDIDMDGIS